MPDLTSLSNTELLNYIKTIGYPTMLILMIIEGPIITILAAFLASLGLFNIWVVSILSFSGDVIGDIILYYMGYFGGNRILKKAEKVLRVKPKIIERMENLFEKHGTKTIFAVKSTTGLCWITFIAAGSVKMKISKFLKGSLGGGVIWTAILISSGYFFGYAFERINSYIEYAGIVIVFLAIVFYIGLSYYKKIQSQKITEKKNS